MKNRTLLLSILMVVSIATNAQEKLITRTGEITFKSKTPIENIEAKNSQVASIFLVDKKTIAFNALLRSFRFEKALMEEHFNEKYVHSDKYPSAKFEGVIQEDIDLKKSGTYNDVTVKGTMDFHGVTKPMEVSASIIVSQDGSVNFASMFLIKLEDYKIEVPSLVKDKISGKIQVNVAANYTKQERDLSALSN